MKTGSGLLLVRGVRRALRELVEGFLPIHFKMNLSRKDGGAATEHADCSDQQSKLMGFIFTRRVPVRLAIGTGGWDVVLMSFCGQKGGRSARTGEADAANVLEVGEQSCFQWHIARRTLPPIATIHEPTRDEGHYRFRNFF